MYILAFSDSYLYLDYIYSRIIQENKWVAQWNQETHAGFRSSALVNDK